MPASSARRRTRRRVSSSPRMMIPPTKPPPKTTSETWRPVRPNRLYLTLFARLDARGLDHFRPLRDFRLDERGELGGRIADHVDAELVEFLLHVRQRERLEGVLMQAVDERGRRARGRHQPEP